MTTIPDIEALIGNRLPPEAHRARLLSASIGESPSKYMTATNAPTVSLLNATISMRNGIPSESNATVSPEDFSPKPSKSDSVTCSFISVPSSTIPDTTEPRRNSG